MMHLLKKMNPDIIIGHYYSACTTTAQSRLPFPATKIALEICRPQWLLRDADGKKVSWPGQPKRYFLDMRKSTVRKMVIARAIAKARQLGFNALSFDNCYYGYGVKDASVSAEEWTKAFMAFYKEAGKKANEYGLKCVVNVACRVDDIPEAFRKIAPFVDGIMTELPFHPNIVKNKKLLKAEVEAYQHVLEMNKMVLLLQVHEERSSTTLKWGKPLAEKYSKMYIVVKGWKKNYPLRRE
jgi:hypothetical protein